ncbi:MAG TPA: hypothetical protein VMT27_07680 [Actinomycetes bacterium]|nr:hypothetical protein [Actinomycetes bacterium]
MSEHRFEDRYLVVTGGDCDEHPGQSCVLRVHGPFNTIEEIERMHRAGEGYREDGFGVHYMHQSPLMGD